ncbi:Rad52/Rad22 family DNA repair protein [Methyloceanibacter sp. wino2]|uniref:Rad52/Rad22 family DNA repair protein n=1 Tax=Methyloceanibacter sp. wino2 TaxID=2170729 RepID=UPI001ABAEE36|nr:Rad52/Rad22 family DNA repair protein [Methyloceanibacter sp. wino2]
MTFTDTQIRQLRAKLDPKHIRTRNADGAELSYLEGWHLISEANRIFGFDAWDRRTLRNSCIWSGSSGEFFVATYAAKVQISVRAAEVTIVRDGSGCGTGRSRSRGDAHDLALKAAETDATKRALSTFGNPFGLPLYDPNQGGVRKPKKMEADETPPSWTLQPLDGQPAVTLGKPSDFVEALREAMSAAPDIESLFALWERNVDEVRSVNRILRQGHLTKSGAAPQLVEHLKRCAVALAQPPRDSGASEPAPTTAHKANGARRPKVDKSVLTIAEPRRIRNKEHLRYVASQPCVVCGRRPAHAHHLRHAQSRGTSLKVSDEFTVPLCALHHGDVHRVGREENWWRGCKIDPLPIARTLWEGTLRRGERNMIGSSANLPESGDNGVEGTEVRP